MADVRVFANAAELNLRAAEAVAAIISSAVRARGRCSLALSGGETPRALYDVLATTFREQIPWPQVHVFWGDERVVPVGSALRNDQMAREMLLSKVACPEAHIHPMATGPVSADEAARDYEETMRQYFSDNRPRFDLVLLGLGAEGHTASLFPNSPALDEQVRWVRAVEVPADPPSRLTLTLPVLSQAANAYFLVAGAGKARALRAALNETTDPKTCPAAAIRLADGALTWWVDTTAANTHRDQDKSKGATEGADQKPVPQDPIGANVDDSEVSRSGETGKTSDAPRDEERPLHK